jgi:transcriptional regulator with XRE-family HTH domain
MTSETVPAWTLGDRLWKARTSSNTSVATMADALGVNRKTINNYERMRTPITRGNVLAWAMVTRFPAEWLLTGEEPSRAPSGGGQNLKKKNVIDLHVPTTVAAPVLLAA